MSTSSRPRLTIPGSPAARPSLRHLSTVRLGLVVSALLLAVVGLATVHSASAEMSMDFLPRQALWVVVGLLALLAAFSIDYHILLDLALPLYLGGALVLVAVLVLGEEHGGARSWIGLGSLGGQPAELMKLLTVLLLARYLANVGRRHLGLQQLLVASGIVVLPVVLVALQPDYGSAAVFLPILGGMLLVAGIRLRTLAAFLPIALALLLAAFFFGLKDYQRQRILAFASPGSDLQGAGYQVHQSKIAVGSGQLTGRGYMQGTQSQLRFLPERHTDFILAVLAEEWGFLGVAAVLGLYALYLTEAAKVGARARDRSGILLVVGLLSGFGFHVLYNSAMVVGLLPITGIPLPFLSYGGSFTLINFLATGLILSVDLRRHVNR